jgi:cathepsin D
MAGFSVENQVFGVCNRVSSGLLNNPVSGLLGLAFQTIASSKAQPLWQTLVTSNAWDEPLMSFQLTRCVILLMGAKIRFDGAYSICSILSSNAVDFLH